MKARSPAPSWLRWLLLAACAGCLNPHADDEPTAVPVATAPGGNHDEGSGVSTGSNGTPPLLLGDDDQSAGQEPEPSQEVPGAFADAGVPAADAGVTGADAGPSETP